MDKEDVMALVVLVQDAQTKVDDAQHQLRHAKAKLTSAVLTLTNAQHLIEMGILSINIRTVKRFARMEARDR